MTHATLRNVYVNAESLIFRRGRIAPETFALPPYAEEYRQLGVYTRFVLKNYWLRRGAVRVPSALWAIDNVSDNYFHWIVESLPRLLRAEIELPDQHVLLLPHRFRQLAFVPFTLRAFPHIQRVHWVEARSKVHVARLDHVPRLPPQPPERLPDQRELAEVARRVRRLAGKKGGSQRIYFSRADAQSGRRRAVNEAEVIRVLRDHDFDIIHNDLAKPWEQIESSAGAEVMVGIHGAALTNVLFLPKGARLLELEHPEHHWTVYGKLARMFGIGYRSQVCSAAQPGSSVNRDLVVDLDQLRENLWDVL